MEHIFAVHGSQQLERYQNFADRTHTRIDAFLKYLRSRYGLVDLPDTIIWTDCKTATEVFSDIPIPAYTNDKRIVISPELHEWQSIYKMQLDAMEDDAEVNLIRSYYDTMLTENHVLQILGHELAHHIDLFEDHDNDCGIWFEEGMVEYISRRFFLTEAEYIREKEINQTLVGILNDRYGNHSLSSFGKETYKGDYASIFFEYWRSFLAVDKLVEAASGDVLSVFHVYRNWIEEGCPGSLEDWMVK